MSIDHAEHPVAVLGDAAKSVGELRIACVSQCCLGRAQRQSHPGRIDAPCIDDVLRVLREYKAGLHVVQGSASSDFVRYAIGCTMAGGQPKGSNARSRQDQGAAILEEGLFRRA